MHASNCSPMSNGIPNAAMHVRHVRTIILCHVKAMLLKPCCVMFSVQRNLCQVRTLCRFQRSLPQWSGSDTFPNNPVTCAVYKPYDPNCNVPNCNVLCSMACAIGLPTTARPKVPAALQPQQQRSQHLQAPPAATSQQQSAAASSCRSSKRQRKKSKGPSCS